MSKKQEKAPIYRPEPTITATKHWIVYTFPTALIIAGFILFSNESSGTKAVGGILALAGLIIAISKASEKWHLTDDQLVIEKGIPGAKKTQHIALHDIYKTSTEHHKLSKYFRMGHIRTRRRADNCSGFSHSFISNHEEFSKAIQSRVQKRPSAKNLNDVYELKEKGAISAKEYDLINLGHITQQYLSKF